ncbi:uncharacterized protein TNCV_3190681 [Trichonephila clavipes]|nr:uncharacterized protein TNCV_3190681 [Trichonephila clavipes]
MMLISALIVLISLLWNENLAIKLPETGECEDSFIDIYPPLIMETWYVIMHTDSLHVAPTPKCLIMKFGRRMSFNTEIRIDIIHSKTKHMSETENLPSLRGEVTAKGREPFGVHVPSKLNHSRVEYLATQKTPLKRWGYGFQYNLPFYNDNLQLYRNAARNVELWTR